VTPSPPSPAPPPPPIDRAAVTAALRAAPWPKIRAQLLRFAIARCKSRQRADDLVQDALVKVMSPTSSWNPATQPDVTRYLMGAIMMNMSTDRRSARARRDVPLSRGAKDDDAREGDHLRDANAFSEDVAARADLLTGRMTALRARLAGDALALELLELTVNGADTPAERCAATGRSHEAVESARRRMQHHAAQIAVEISGEIAGVDDGARARERATEEDESEVA
jgi:DNA-directed RNA polymerase specialized sigma24 family protein